MCKLSGRLASQLIIPCTYKIFETTLVFRILNLGKVTKVPKLNEDKAIEEGAQLLSEIVILSIAAGLVMFEYRRSSEKEDAKQVHLSFHNLLLIFRAFKPNVVHVHSSSSSSFSLVIQEAMEKEKLQLYQRIVELELGMDRRAAEIRQLQRQQEKAKWFPSLGTKKQDESASTETEKVIAKSPEVTNATKVVSYDDQIQSERNLAKSAMSSPKMSDVESGHSSGVAEEGLIMGAVSDFLDEKRVMSTWPRYSKSLPLPGEDSGYKKGAVLEAVDDFLDTLEECRDD